MKRDRVFSVLLVLCVVIGAANIAYLYAAPPATPANTLNGVGLNVPYLISQTGYSIGANEVISSLRAADFTGYNLSGVNKTDIFAYPQTPYDQVVYVSGGAYYAKDGADSSVYTNADADVVIQYAYDNGDSVLITSGDYPVNTMLRFDAENKTVTGYGARLYLPGGFATNGFYMVNVSAVHNTLIGLELDGNKDAVSNGQTGVYIYRTNSTRLYSLYIHSFRIDGVIASTTPYANYFTEIISCTISDCLDDCLDINYMISGVVSQCIIKNAGDNGVDTEKSRLCVFSNNLYDNCGTSGQELEDETNDATTLCTVIGNTFKDCTYGVWIYSGGNNTVTGNTFVDCTYGVRILTHPSGDPSTDNVISNNVIQRCTYGVSIRDADCVRNTVSGNSIYEVTNGITVRNNTLVQGNFVTDFDDTGAIIVNGPGCSITGNVVDDTVDASNNKIGIVIADGSDNCLIATNEIRYVREGIRVDSDSCLVSGNLIYGDGVDLQNGAYGIRIGYGSTAHNNTFTGNKIIDYAVNGIIEYSTTGDYSFIMGNDISGTPTPIIYNAHSIVRFNKGFTSMGDVRNNAGNVELWNSTAWVIIGP